MLKNLINILKRIKIKNETAKNFMKNKIKTICFDIDNTICKVIKMIIKIKPIKRNIKFINLLFNKGYYIKIFTSRFMGKVVKKKFS